MEVSRTSAHPHIRTFIRRCCPKFRFFFLAPLFFLSGGFQLTAQCNVDPGCLIHDVSAYICLEPPPAATMRLSNFIAPNGPLPQGGGFVNVIIDGDLVVDVDYTFNAGAHVLLTPGSSITVDDNMPNNNSGPRLAVTDYSTLSSCDGYWKYIVVTDDHAELKFEDAIISGGGNDGITIVDGASLSSVNSNYDDFIKHGITLGNAAGGPPQEVSLTLVGNKFFNIQRPLTILNTQMISIGAGNEFSSNSPPIADLAAIFINSSSVSIGEGNKFTGYSTGIYHINQSENPHFLSVNGANFKNNVNGIKADDGVTNGSSLFVKNSTFDGNSSAIDAIIQDGGTCELLQNTISNNNGNVIALIGRFPNRVEVSDNVIQYIGGNSGVGIRMASWNAGNNMKVSKNIIDGNQTAIFVSLGSGGIVENNDIVTTGPTGILVRNSSGVQLTGNNVSGAGGDSETNGGIFIENSPNCKLVCNSTFESAGGLSFFGYCDGALVANNNMNYHDRGLSVHSFYSDGVIGPQPYRSNRWVSGMEAVIAEASMTSLFDPLTTEHYKMSQFIIEQNSGLLWPDPILPAQSPAGSPDEWFWYQPQPYASAPCEEALREPVDPGAISLFDDGIINGAIGEVLGGEGKYRDIDFYIYYKFRKDPSSIIPEYEDYYDVLNTESFQKRYDVTVKMEEMSELSNNLPIEEHITALSNQLEWLVLYDDGTQQPQRDSILNEIKSTLAGIESIMGPYRSALAADVEAIIQLAQNWEGEEPADDILKEVLNIYFNNFGVGFEAYSEAEQDTIQEYAGLCVEEFGRGVYLANAIAGTLNDYDLVEYCVPSSHRVVSETRDTKSGRIEVFPSPSTGIVNIRASMEEIKSLQVFDALGNRIMDSAPSSGNLQTIYLEQEPSGLYFIAIIHKNGERQVEKVLLHR